MNTLLLRPSDVLFFRDGRPMSGSLTGHGAAWPLPHTIHAAFHAALHRAGPEMKAASHEHRPARNGKILCESRTKLYGSLQSVGPFPVDTNGNWYFPRPLDANDESGIPSLIPTKLPEGSTSSLPQPLQLVVENKGKQSKDKPAAWWTPEKFKDYFNGNAIQQAPKNEAPDAKQTRLAGTCDDSAIFGAEHTIGIRISPETGTQDKKRFYTASYLRLKEGWRLGTLAATAEKQAGQGAPLDLIGQKLFTQGGILVAGGQQRICQVELTPNARLPLPKGRCEGFAGADGKFRVKWILLTPAIFQKVGAHPGGWLPTWIDHTKGTVLLPRGDRPRHMHQRETREAWRARIKEQGDFGTSGTSARLVAACTGKPLAITGWSLEQGSKSTHLAVPAGSVYYFECDSAEVAKDLAAALNWHGAANDDNARILNRRSGIFGEKGFGLGICGTW